MLISALQVTRYPLVGGPYTNTTIERPSWDVVEEELRAMHNWEKPLLWLCKDRDVGYENCMAVCGGSGVFHVQVADNDGNWFQAVDPHGSDQPVDVWLSDQGFTTKARYTWPVDKAVELVRWYFEHGTMEPRYAWE
ncbi:MAG TPA: hypothetical protein VFE47_20285 [Tepidisphaeraceae bacterium]|nr:hypothetical protein [Tepidisphaeraceae bacterium]